MATSTYLSNPAVFTLNTVDLKDQCSSVTLNLGQVQLDRTAFGDTALQYVGGLYQVSGSITFYVDYGASSVDATIYAALGAGTNTIVVKKDNAAISASNPEYTISNTFIPEMPITYTMGELQIMEMSFEGGTFVRDITP